MKGLATRELSIVSKLLGWEAGCLETVSVDSAGPGNVLTLELQSDEVTEVFTGFGEKGVSAESLAETAVGEVRRYLAAMINEGAKVVHEGIALRPLDVDVTFVAGYGFPRHRGGPMKYADTVGLPQVLADICEFAKEDALFWRPSPLLLDLVERSKDFDSLNKAA